MRRNFLKVSTALLCVGLLFVGCKKNKAADLLSRGGGHSDENPDFTVLTFAPDGELPSTVKYPSIQIQFSKPVIALEKLGEPSDKSDLVTIDPPLNGVYRWFGTSLLSFESSEPCIPQKEYKVTVNPKATSLDGTKISGNTQFMFHTEELQVTSVIPGYEEVKQGNYVDDEDVPVELARDVAVFFNAPVNASYISKYITVQSSNETKLEYTAAQESENCVRLTLKKVPEEDISIWVTLASGAMADKDCYPTSEESEYRYHTITPFALARFRSEEMYMDSKYANPVTFVMSHQLKQGSEAEAAKWITTTPAMTVTADNIYINGTNLTVHSLPVTFESEYKIKLSGEAHDVYGRKLGSSVEEKVKVPPARSYASFKDYGFHILESQFAPKLVFEHQNILAGSKYSVEPVSAADGSEPKAEQQYQIVELNPDEIPQNKRIIEAVDLIPSLQKVSGGAYRGAIKFNADMKYQYRYIPWYSDSSEAEIRTSSTGNTQYIQVTDLGVTVRYGYNKIIALVTSLSTGKPVANATVGAMWMISPTSDQKLTHIAEGYHYDAVARTDSNGVAVLTDYSLSSDFVIEVKTKDDRVVFSPNSHRMWSTSAFNIDSVGFAKNESRQVTFLFTDRGLYKPGETVTFRGIDRTLKTGKYSSYANKKYTVQLTDGSWNPTVYAELKGTTSSNGTMWGSFKIPADAEPGYYTIRYSRGEYDRYNSPATCSIQVQFFERLRFEAKSSIANITYYSGDTLNAQINAQYLGGGSMGNASYDSWWTREPVGFSPKSVQYDGFAFGPQKGYDGRTSLNSSEGMLDGAGAATESQKTGGEKLDGMAYAYRFEAQVTDSGNQTISTTARTVVHPAKFYIGVSSPKGVNGFAKKGDTVTFDYVCVTPEETAPLAKDLPTGKNKKLKVELLRYEWKQVQQVSWNGQINTRYEQTLEVENEQELDLSGTATRTSFTVVPPKGGSYLIRLTTQDARENKIITERHFYVTSSDWYWFNRDDAEEISMTPDKSQYAVGDTAHILMQSPLEKGTYLMTVEREGILSHKVMNIDVPTSVIDVPIEEGFVPVMYVTLSSYSVRDGKPQNDYDTPDLGKPKGYFGLATLVVDPAFKSFDISVTTDKPSYRPGEKATVTLRATKNGKAVPNAEITLMAVDRGVIDLIDYHVRNPIEHFYNPYLFPDCVKGGDSRSLLIDPVTYEIKNLVGGDADEEDSAKFTERKNFEPTAVFVPNLVTDANGNVTYTFTLPDSLTAYRITAVGVKEDTFGISESQMDVAEPISVRSVLPRQLRVNDQGELGVTISNLTSGAQDVTVSLAVYSGVEKTGVEQSEDDVQKLPGLAAVNGEAQKTLKVPANSTQALMFMIDAKLQGWITVEFTVKSNLINERILLPLEIQKNYIFETVTTIGELPLSGSSAKTEEMIVIPSGADDNQGSLYVQLDPTRLGTLTESVNYVFRYPYGCMEQRSAGVFPLLAFGDYIKVFGLQSEVRNPKRVAAKEIASWGKVQLRNGAFPYWPTGTEANNYVTFRIGEILALALNQGLKVDKDIDINKLSQYIGGEVNKLTYGNNGKNALSGYSAYTVAYGCYVIECLDGGKGSTAAHLQKVLDANVQDIPTLALCGLAYLKSGKTDKAQAIAELLRKYTKYSSRGIDIASPNQDYWYWSFLNGKVEDYSLMLQFFSEYEPDSDINQRLVYELLELQRSSHGYWVNTSQTTRALIAIRSYIKNEGLESTNFTAAALLNGKKFVDGSFKGLGADPVEKTADFTEEPVRGVKRNVQVPVEFQANGQGKLFYTVSMKYAIPAAEQKARDEGLCVYTEIIDVKTGERVTDDKLVAGNVYRQVVYLSSTRTREFVALRATIPAGAEVLNAAFVTTGSVSPDTQSQEKDYDDWDEYWDDYYDDWYENYNWGLSHQAIYDSEVQYFWNYFPAGNQSVEFLFRATRKGTYNTPSSTAECMYQDEIFGRSSGKVWTIE